MDMDTTKMEDKLHEIGERIQPRIEDAKRRIDRLDDQVRSIIKEHPTACLLGAVALGYLVARVARDRS